MKIATESDMMSRTRIENTKRVEDTSRVRYNMIKTDHVNRERRYKNTSFRKKNSLLMGRESAENSIRLTGVGWQK